MFEELQARSASQSSSPVESLQRYLSDKGFHVAEGGVRKLEAVCPPELVSEWGAVESYPPGGVLFRQGERSAVVYEIEQGWVKLVRVEEDGEAMIVGVRGRGWILGAAAVLIGQEHAVTAETATWCQLRRMSAEEFRDRVRRDEAFSWRVHEMHAREIYQQLEQVVGLGCQKARRRLGQLLRELAEGRGEGRWRCPLRQWELAQLVAITPSYLSQLLRELEQEKVLRREKGWIMIEDWERL